MTSLSEPARRCWSPHAGERSGDGTNDFFTGRATGSVEEEFFRSRPDRRDEHRPNQKQNGQRDLGARFHGVR